MSEDTPKTIWEQQPKVFREKWFIGLGAIMLVTSALYFSNFLREPHSANIEKIREAFPKTDFERIAYNKELGLYELESGSTITYMKGSRYFIAGEVIDLEKNKQITKERRAELKDVIATKEAVFGGNGPSNPSAQEREPVRAQGTIDRERQKDGAPIINVDLPETNYAVHNKGAGEVIYVVSDYNCPHCRNLFNELKSLPYEVREIPVGFLRGNSETKGASVLCASDKSEEVTRVYNLPGTTTLDVCDEGMAHMSENTRWAVENGVTSTPGIIAPDGRLRLGGGPAQMISAFLEDNTAAPQKVDVNLPEENMVVYNQGASDILYVVSDYNCGFCAQLHETLSSLDIEVREIPVGFKGQNSVLKAASVLCSDTKEQDGAAAFYKASTDPVTTCSQGETWVEDNTNWAVANNFNSTPTLITPDGRSVSGAMPAQSVMSFIRGGRS